MSQLCRLPASRARGQALQGSDSPRALRLCALTWPVWLFSAVLGTRLWDAFLTAVPLWAVVTGTCVKNRVSSVSVHSGEDAGRGGGAGLLAGAAGRAGRGCRPPPLALARSRSLSNPLQPDTPIKSSRVIKEAVKHCLGLAGGAPADEGPWRREGSTTAAAQAGGSRLSFGGKSKHLCCLLWPLHRPLRKAARPSPGQARRRAPAQPRWSPLPGSGEAQGPRCRGCSAGKVGPGARAEGGAMGPDGTGGDSLAGRPSRWGRGGGRQVWVARLWSVFHGAPDSLGTIGNRCFL